MKTAINSVAIVGLSLLTLAGARAQSTTVAGWNFENYTTGGTNTTTVADLGVNSNSASAQSVGMSLTNGPDISGVTTEEGIDSNNTATNNTVWRVRGSNGWNSNEGIGTQGAQFDVSTAGFSNISIGFDLSITSQGEANFEVLYTTNGSTWLNASSISIGSSGTALNSGDTSFSATTEAYYVTNNSGGADPHSVAGTFVHTEATNDAWFDGITVNLTNVPSVNNDPNFGFEIVNASTGSSDVALKGTALNNTSGNWRFDNVTVSGTSAVPEPSTYALFIGGIALVAGFMIRRKVAKS